MNQIESQKLMASHQQQIYSLKNKNYQPKVEQQQKNGLAQICDIIKQE